MKASDIALPIQPVLLSEISNGETDIEFSESFDYLPVIDEESHYIGAIHKNYLLCSRLNTSTNREMCLDDSIP